jgi:hypothetical protein
MALLKNCIKGCNLTRLSCSFKVVDAENGSFFELNGHVLKHKRAKQKKQPKGSS